MIVIVETNFILELVFQQEQSEACEELLHLCSKSEQFRLVVSAFAVSEAGMKIERRQGERRKFLEHVQAQKRESERSKLLLRFGSVVSELDRELIVANREEASKWRYYRIVLSDWAQIIPLTSAVLDEALAIQVGRDIAKFPDALILGSVLEYLREMRARGDETPTLFLSTDEQAFRTENILRQLRELGCTYVNSFQNAVSRLKHAPTA